MANVAVSVVFKTSLEFIATVADVFAEPLPNVRPRNERTADINDKAGINAKKMETVFINPRFINGKVTAIKIPLASALKFLIFPKKFLKVTNKRHLTVMLFPPARVRLIGI